MRAITEKQSPLARAFTIKEVVTIAAEFLVIAILVIAAAYDIEFMKIPNWLILLGLMAGSQYLFLCEGGIGLVHFIVKAILPVFILYVLFLMKVLGAGDIKLFSIIAVFLSGRAVLTIVLLSFFYGALISFILMLSSKELLPRLNNFRFYVINSGIERRITEYHTFDSKRSYLHFSIYILLAALTYFTFENYGGISI